MNPSTARALSGSANPNALTAFMNPDALCYALIVGISDYQDERIRQLRFAHRDAEALYAFLLEKSGGRFVAERMRLLTNKQATLAGLNEGLRDFLQQPQEDDLVVIYLACHGAPDPKRPQNLYLITHDTRWDKIAATALPMDDIQRTIDRNLLAQRIVVLADTCHSGGVTTTMRGDENHSGAVNTFLKQMGKGKGGVAMMSSAQANQLALEDADLGGGHGVFTYHLLEGLRGAADGYRPGQRPEPGDGVVTVGELFDYVREKVQATTNNAQVPDIHYEEEARLLPMAVSGGDEAERRMQIGQSLLTVGQMLQDRARLHAAAHYFAAAHDCAALIDRQGRPDALLQQGYALLLAGDNQEVLTALAPLEGRADGGGDGRGWLYLALAHARLGDLAKAEPLLDKFLATAPATDPHYPWAEYFRQCVQGGHTGRRVALLIGIGAYQDPKIGPLQGPPNDLRLMRDVLEEVVGFQPNEIIILADAQATGAAIIAALEQLAQVSYEAVVVYYSGHAEMNSGADDPYLMPYDYDLATPTPILSPRYLDEAMRRIPTRHKTLLLDTHGSWTLVEIASAGGPDYTLLMGSQFDNTSYEVQTQTSTGEPLMAGLFTAAFVEEVRSSWAKRPNLNEFTIALGERMAGRSANLNDIQKSTFAGDNRNILFTADNTPLSLWTFLQQRRFFGATPPQLQGWAQYATDYSGTLAPDLQVQVMRQVGVALLDLPALYERGDIAYYLQYAFAAQPTAHTAVQLLYALAQQWRVQEWNALWPDLMELLTTPAQRELLAQVLLYANQPDLAQKVLDDLPVDASTAFLRAVAAAFSGKAKRAQAAFAAVLKQAGVAPRQEVWARWATGAQGPRRHLLLIGIGEYDILGRVEGPITNVTALHTVVSEKFTVSPDTIHSLTNAQATRAAVWQALETLKNTVLPGDEIIAYFSGFVFDGPDPTDASKTTPALLVYDTDLERNAELFYLQAFLNLTADLPTEHKTVIVDGRGPELAPDRIEAPRGVKVLWRVTERRFEDHVAGPSMSQSTRWLVNYLKNDYKSRQDVRTVVAASAMGTPVAGKSEEVSHQYFFGAGDTAQPLFAATLKAPTLTARVRWLADKLRETLTQSDPIARLYAHMAQMELRTALQQLTSASQQRATQGDPWPEGALSLGMAHSALGDYATAAQFLQRAADIYTNEPPAEATRDHAVMIETFYQLGRVLTEGGADYDRAVSYLRRAIALNPDLPLAYYFLGEALAQQIEGEKPRELVAAFRHYLRRGAPMGDVERVRALVSRYGPPPTNLE